MISLPWLHRADRRDTPHSRRIPRLAAVVLWVAIASACGREVRPNIVLITLDTTRSDRLGCYGYAGATSPNLDRFAAEGVLHTRAYSNSSWTFPAHASLFTGKFTTSHGAKYDPDGSLLLTSVVDGPERWSRFRARGLAPDERTLATLLARAGYATGAVVAGPWLKRAVGLDAGFGHWDDEGISSMNGRRAPEVTDRGLAWLDDAPDRPFFLFLNYFDPHQPLAAPREFVRDHSARAGVDPILHDLDRRYDAEIRFMDHHLGRFFRGLRERGLYEASWIIVTADHGELLGEHGLKGHGNTLHEELIRIPLIVKYPGSGGSAGTVHSPAQLVDVFATILDHLGLPIPPDAQGDPLGEVGHPVIAELFPLDFMRNALRGSSEEWRGEIQTLHRGDYKFVWSSEGRHQLFDLALDPHESENRMAELGEVAASMQAELKDYVTALPGPAQQGAARQVDPETEEALRNLGYIE